MAPVAGGEKDDGKFRYSLDAWVFWKNWGYLNLLRQRNLMDSIVLKSRNPKDAWDLLQDQETKYT